MSKYSVSVDDIITTNAKQFISYEEKKLLALLATKVNGSTTQHPMYTEIYDRDNDNIVDIAQKAIRADSVLWNNILDKPDFTIGEFEASVENTHKHSNKSILDGIELDENFNLIFNKIPIKFPNNLMYIEDYDIDNDGMIDRAFYAESTTWENILNKPLYYLPEKHTHSGNDIYGNINATTFNGLTADAFLRKNDRIDISQIDNLDSISITVSEIHGGNSTSSYDGYVDETMISLRGDTLEKLVTINPLLNNLEQCYETDFYRYKIGNGYIPWNGLPYIYNTPESARFNYTMKKFINFYDWEEKYDAITSKVDIELTNDNNDALYSNVVRGTGNKIIGIPYNTNEVLSYDTYYENLTTFGSEIIDGVYGNGAMWYGGVTYNEYVYCAPYNTNYILKIDTNNNTCILINVPYNVNNNICVNGVLSNNNLIYFAPHNIDYIIELDPRNDTLKQYQNSSIFNTSENCCAVINNPIDNLLYFIPKKNNKIVQFNPITKEMKVVTTVEGAGYIKYNTAILGTNGLIYAFPSYGYNYIMIFDPNTYTVEYIDIQIDILESYNSAIMAPNNKIYLIPSGVGIDEIGKVIEFDINTNTYKVIHIEENAYNRWCGGILTVQGNIICLPYTNNEILKINTSINGTIPLECITTYFK